MLVANGNFKADHVQQKHMNTDVWLLDGGGMAPEENKYKDFLRMAIERSTVGPCQSLVANAGFKVAFTESTL